MSSPRAVFGPELVLQGEEGQGSRDLVISLLLGKTPEDNPFISSELLGWKLFAYK